MRLLLAFRIIRPYISTEVNTMQCLMSLHQTLQGNKRKTKSPARHREAYRSRLVRLGCEVMEDRVLMSTGLPDYHFTAPALVAGTTQHGAPSSIGAFTKTPGGTTQRTQPAQIDYGVAAQNQTAASAPSAVTIYSVVTIRNETNNIIYYSLQWPGSNSTDFSVAPYSSRIHWGTGENVTPTIKYDWSFARLPGTELLPDLS